MNVRELIEKLQTCDPTDDMFAGLSIVAFLFYLAIERSYKDSPGSPS